MAALSCSAASSALKLGFGKTWKRKRFFWLNTYNDACMYVISHIHILGICRVVCWGWSGQVKGISFALFTVVTIQTSMLLIIPEKKGPVLIQKESLTCIKLRFFCGVFVHQAVFLHTTLCVWSRRTVILVWKTLFNNIHPRGWLYIIDSD